MSVGDLLGGLNGLEQRFGTLLVHKQDGDWVCVQIYVLMKPDKS
jgi:hypothetical protein